MASFFSTTENITTTIQDTLNTALKKAKSDAIRDTVENVVASPSTQRLIGSEPVRTAQELLRKEEPAVVEAIATIAPAAEAGAGEMFQNLGTAHLMLIDGVSTPQQAKKWFEKYGMTDTIFNARQNTILNMLDLHWDRHTQEAGSAISKAVNDIAGAYVDKQRIRVDAASTRVMQNSVLAHIMSLHGINNKKAADEWLSTKRGITKKSDPARHDDIMAIFNENLKSNNQLSTSLVGDAVKELWDERVEQLQDAAVQKTDKVAAAAENAALARIMAMRGIDTEQDAEKWLEEKRGITKENDPDRHDGIMASFNENLLKEKTQRSPTSLVGDAVQELWEERVEQLQDAAVQKKDKLAAAVETAALAHIMLATGVDAADEKAARDYIAQELAIPEDNPRHKNVLAAYKKLTDPSAPQTQARALIARALAAVGAQQRVKIDAAMTNIIESSVIAHVMMATGVANEDAAAQWLEKRNITKESDPDRYNDVIRLFNENQRTGAERAEAAISDAIAQIANEKLSSAWKAVLAKGAPVYISVVLLHLASYGIRQKLRADLDRNTLRLKAELDHQARQEHLPKILRTVL